LGFEGIGPYIISNLLAESCDYRIGIGISNHCAAMAAVRRRGDLDVNVLAKIVEEAE